MQGLATWHGGSLLSVLEPSMLDEVHIEMDFGEADLLIPLSDVEKIQALFRNHPNIKIRTHEKSGHGFTHTGTVKYNEAQLHYHLNLNKNHGYIKYFLYLK